jgi:hypothetical protein
LIRVPRNVLLAAGIAAGLLVGVAAGAITSCEDSPPASPPVALSGSAPASAPATADTAEPTVAVPPPVSDGCHGLVVPAQVAKATGLALTPGGGDQAGAAAQYTEALQSLGLHATVRLCAFGDARGNQVYAMALGFPDAAQASRMFADGRGAASLRNPEPVPGVGDAAVTDRSHTLLVRRRSAVLLVYLVMAGDPDGDHLAALRALAVAGLGRL